MKLRAAKHDVIGLTRSQSGAAQLRELGIEPLVADLLDRDGLLRAIAGMNADAVGNHPALSGTESAI